MSGFSAEYLAEVEAGMKLVTETRERLEGVEQLLDQKPTADTIKAMLKQLGLCAEYVTECEGFGAIMPHDSDELREKYMTLAQQAAGWVEL
ncbi:hypothetical protein [Halomonas sp. 3A7M]|uniref:hypothetical protein n=1 Tax=Halomonas sp. 3A7M TaxID=2742616 RepID=UPI001865D524|nr:hypothetical protein [Halomonas sp. 3A7M]